MSIQETWKDIPGIDGYKASDQGRILSSKGVTPRVLSQSLNKQGYYKVNLYINKECKQYRVHQLVAMAFLNHKLGGTLVVDHIDNNRQLNVLDNLQLITQRENLSKDKWRLNNTSKYIGVSWNKDDRKWRADIKINGKATYLGGFTNELDARQAYLDKLSTL